MLFSSGLLAASALLTGCGMGPMASTTGATPTAGQSMNGVVHGGLAPVTGATIQLWAAGTAGNGSAATSLLTGGSVLTDSNGNFSITGDYTCPSASTQVYLTSVGGNPGLANGNTNNPGLIMVSALGACGNLSSSSYIFVNEVSTAAAAWALAPFFGSGATAYSSLGASSTNSAGLANAFLNAQVLAPTATGQPTTQTYAVAAENGKLISLANALASCSNSDGTTACSPLYTAATVGSSVPNNIFTAALNIVRNPANNVSAIYSAGGTQPPYSGGLTAAPSDWTMSVTYRGGGVQRPYGIGLDKSGNVWTANYQGTSGSISGFSPQGTALAGSPFSDALLNDVSSLVVDSNNDVWVGNQGYPDNGSGNTGGAFKFYGVSSTGTTGARAGIFSDAKISQPSSLAFDPANGGSVLVASAYGVSVNGQNGSYPVIFHLNGSAPTDTLYSTSVSAPYSLVSDSNGGAWLASYNTGTIVHVDSNNVSTVVACCSAPDGIAADTSGNLWVANYSVTSNSVSEVIAATGAVPVNQRSGGGLYQPSSVVVDAGSHVWVANFNLPSTSVKSCSLSELDTTGNVLSPTGGFGLDAGLIQPRQVIPDASGNLWVANSGANNGSVSGVTQPLGNVVVFLGIATPTATPAGPRPVVP